MLQVGPSGLGQEIHCRHVQICSAVQYRRMDKKALLVQKMREMCRPKTACIDHASALAFDLEEHVPLIEEYF